MKLVWRREARANYREVIEYVAGRDAAAADNLAEAIDTCLKRALLRPMMYRAGRVTGTREAVAHPNYIVVYRIADDTLEVVNVLHARQQYP